MEFSGDDKMRAIQPLAEALFRHVLWDEEPLFVSDEATIFDVSLAPADELVTRLSDYYRTPVSSGELRKPLWQLLPDLERRRLGL
jgi:hypothetical protein